MSESREHKRRYYERVAYFSAMDKWLDSEPSPLRIIAHARWKKKRPQKPR